MWFSFFNRLVWKREPVLYFRAKYHRPEKSENDTGFHSLLRNKSGYLQSNTIGEKLNPRKHFLESLL